MVDHYNNGRSEHIPLCNGILLSLPQSSIHGVYSALPWDPGWISDLFWPIEYGECEAVWFHEFRLAAPLFTFLDPETAMRWEGLVWPTGGLAATGEEPKCLINIQTWELGHLGFFSLRLVSHQLITTTWVNPRKTPQKNCPDFWPIELWEIISDYYFKPLRLCMGFYAFKK